jgi:hypothetical protein
MEGWTPTPERHREIVALWRLVKEERDVAVEMEQERLSLEDFRRLPRAERKARWFATWKPWLRPRFGIAWRTLIGTLSDGEWHVAEEVREAMVAASGIGTRTARAGLWQALQAGVTEEHRLDGSKWLRNRLVRMREDAPRRLVDLPPEVGLVSHD